MNIQLLYHLNSENYHPLYKLSTKGTKKTITFDGYIEYDPPEGDFLGEVIEFFEEDDEQCVNKDWLIRAKRENKADLANKFYRIDE
jgi:hypothetical protein